MRYLSLERCSGLSINLDFRAELIKPRSTINFLSESFRHDKFSLHVIDLALCHTWQSIRTAIRRLGFESSIGFHFVSSQMNLHLSSRPSRVPCLMSGHSWLTILSPLSRSFNNFFHRRLPVLL